MVKKLLIFVLLFNSGSVLSDTWVDDASITDVRWYEGDIGYISIDKISNAECNSGASNGVNYLDTNTSGHDKMISMALSAMMAKSKVKILVDGCYGDHARVKGLIVKAL